MRASVSLSGLFVALACIWAPALPSFGAPLELTSPTSAYIEQYCKCEFNPHVGTWGQGHTDDGKPNLEQDGAAAGFVGGAEGDIWRPMGEPRKYCNGAVGRTFLWVWANCDVRVRVVNHELYLVDGAGRQIAATAWLGRKHWEDCNCSVWIREEWENLRPICCLGLCMYLYCCAERQGLSDAAGTYSGTVTVEVLPMD